MNRCIKPRRLTLSKLEAARGQIESAIWLWFLDGDMASIDTLVTSAQRLLRDVAGLWEKEAWPCTAGYFPDWNSERELCGATNDAVKYFNCAKEEETYELSEQWTELSLFDAVMAYCNLGQERGGSVLMSTFVLRFGVQRQDLFIPGAFTLLERKVSATFNLDRLERLSKMDFLKEFIGVLGRAPQ